MRIIVSELVDGRFFIMTLMGTCINEGGGQNKQNTPILDVLSNTISNITICIVLGLWGGEKHIFSRRFHHGRTQDFH